MSGEFTAHACKIRDSSLEVADPMSTFRRPLRCSIRCGRYMAVALSSLSSAVDLAAFPSKLKDHSANEDPPFQETRSESFPHLPVRNLRHDQMRKISRSY